MGNLVPLLDRRHLVRSLIYDPLEGRGDPPRGWTRDAWLEDAVGMLDFPEEVLAKAAAIVRRTWERNTWPLPSTYRKACESLMVDEPRKISAAELGVAQRSTKAWDYVQRRLIAGPVETCLCRRQFKERGAGDIKRWLFAEACTQLRDGAEEVHISNDQVEVHIVEHEAQCLERWGPVTAKDNKLAGNLGETAKAIIDRVRGRQAEEVEL